VFSCKKPECLEQVIMHAIAHSNVSQAKIRALNPEVEEQHCERCDEIASWHVVPIKFGE